MREPIRPIVAYACAISYGGTSTDPSTAPESMAPESMTPESMTPESMTPDVLAWFRRVIQRAVLIEFDFEGETAQRFGMPDAHRHEEGMSTDD